MHAAPLLGHFKDPLLRVFISLFPVFSALAFTLTGFSVVPKQGGRSTRRAANAARQVITTGSQELIDVILGTPSGTFVGGALRLIPSFKTGSRLDLVASQYSQFKILSSVVKYIATTTTSTSGRIALAFTFDTRDPDPTEVAQIIQTSRSRSGALWKNMQVRAPPNSAEKQRYAYINSADYVVLPGADRQIFTPHSVIFGTDSSQQSGLLTGKLVWHYKIQFFNPNTTVATTTTNIFYMELGSADEADARREIYKKFIT